MPRVYQPTEQLPVHRLTEEGIVLWKGDTRWVEPVHTHNFIELVYTYSGHITHEINAEPFRATRGDLFFINFNQTHAYTPEGTVRLCNIMMQPQFLGEELIHSDNAADMLGLSLFVDFAAEMQEIRPITRFRGTERTAIEGLIDDMCREFEEQPPGYRTMLRTMTAQLLVRVFRQMHRELSSGILLDQAGSLSPRILQYIEDNCFERISLTELAKRCYYNPAYFSRTFKKCFGVNFEDFVQEKRIERARELLRTTDKSISSIALEVGYLDRKQFYTVFCRYNDGQTPGEYRKAQASPPASPV